MKLEKNALVELFPAYAGVIPGQLAQDEPAAAFPRLRGGDPGKADKMLSKVSFSPPTRG